MATEHVSVVKATAPRYFKGASDLTYRKRLWLAMLLRYGLVEYNADSTSTTWDILYSLPEVRQYGDAGDQEFNQHDALKQISVDVRGYTATDRLTKKQRLMNKGSTQIYDLYKKKSDNLITALQAKFCGELYIDGNIAGNENRLCGIESFMGYTACAVGDIIAQPNDTYGSGGSTISTVLGAESGSTWSTGLASASRPNATLANDWPYGQGSIEYDFASPKLINYASTGWPSGVATWQDNCEEVLRFAGIVCSNLTGDEGVPMLHMLDAKMFAEFTRVQAARLRIIVPHKESEDLGFSHTLNFEGAAVKFEFDCPAGVGYGITPDAMELFSMEDTLFVPDGPEWVMAKKGWLYEAGFFGNMRFQPKYFAKYADFRT